MGLIKYRLGELIELVTRKNVDLVYGMDDVRGVSNTKGMIPTKADMSTRELDKFYIIKPREFVFNRRTTRNGERLGMAYNDTDRAYIFTSDYVAFRIKDVYRDKLLDDYLYMFFCRDEFDRYVRVNSWGSATEFFNWDNMCDVVIKLPDFDIQSKYVSVYRSMLKNQHSYGIIVDDLKIIIDLLLDDFKHTGRKELLGDLIYDVDRRNLDEKEKKVYGVNMAKEFMPSIANVPINKLKNYKIVQPNELVCNPMHVGRDEKLPITINLMNKNKLVSPAYFVFGCRKNVAPEYIIMWLSRDQSDREIWFHSDGSIRGGIDEDILLNIPIYIPNESKMISVVNIYNAYIKRKKINERLDAILKNICSILIRGAMEEAGA